MMTTEPLTNTELAENRVQELTAALDYWRERAEVAEAKLAAMQTAACPRPQTKGNTMKAYLIGRHSIPFPAEAGIEVVDQQAVTFPATAKECRPILERLADEAASRGAEWLLFVGMPPQVVAALSPWPQTEDGQVMTWRKADPRRMAWLRLGLVVSKPGPRPAGVKTVVEVPADDGYWGTAAVDAVVTAARAANPNAKIEVRPGDSPADFTQVTITCDPPMAFEFSHIEEM